MPADQSGYGPAQLYTEMAASWLRMGPAANQNGCPTKQLRIEMTAKSWLKTCEAAAEENEALNSFKRALSQ